MGDTRTDTPDLEAAALNAAIEVRRHTRKCPICADGSTLCLTRAELLRAFSEAIKALGDDFAARGRAARAL